ncbi:DUF1801 domain-containing protein [Nocardioides dongxiaopingii]|uniref:DUF1801 domain-containing protein n=1 Tax=Nocardioides sp. S-1144 TaxID=2582905 RepID=UPI00116569C3|nr:DUF1801 domain-containing protein [Nocardioides sp. S-1144]QDH10643.1 DUF1801 domain-containing protein [Nocardioides sp. S-1144]
MAAKKDPTAEVLDTIAAMTERDRAVAERLHEVITTAAPELSPRLWYKQPAYALGGPKGKVLCFFRGADVDGERYLSFGFSGEARLDDGGLWPTAYAVTEVTDAVAERITGLVQDAVSGTR